MADKGEGNDRDDLFDDLDRFFSPIEERGWPNDPREGAGTRGRPPADTSSVPSEPTSRPGPQDPVEPAAGEDRPEDQDWNLTLEERLAEPQVTSPGDSTDEPRPPGPPERPAPMQGTDRPAEEPDATETGPPASPPPQWEGAPTGELTSDDWSHLRDVLGEDQEDVEYEFDLGPQAPPPGPDLFGLGDENETSARGGPREPGAPGGSDSTGSEEPPDLDIEDLKKAPPEYRDLPVPGQEEGTQPTAPDEVFDEPEPFVTRAATGRPVGEPSLADLEAAADQLAEEFKTPTPAESEELVPPAERPSEPRRIKVGEPESLMGPTWEEPTSRAVTREGEAERAAPRIGRNVPLAVISAAVLAVVALIALAYDKWAFAVVAGLVALLAQAELYATMKRRGHQPATALGLVAGGLMLAAAYLRGEPGMLLFVVLALLMAFLWYMAAAPKARAGLINNVGSTLLGVLYVPFLAGFVLAILSQQVSGKILTLAVLGLAFGYDVSAFIIGTLWGSRPLAPTISPRKSWEGLFGATVVTAALAVGIVAEIDVLSAGKALGLAAIVVVFAPLGDLVESAIKRDLGVKDMGSIMPGHGGMLDRIDSVLFVAPAAFYFFRLIF